MTMTSDPIRTGLTIGGESVVTAEHFAVYNPARPGEVVGYAGLATEEQARAGIRTAHAAWPGWAAMPAAERGRQLLTAVAGIEGTRAERVELLVRENGKVRAEAEIEMAVFANRCRLAAEQADLVDQINDLPPTPYRTSVERLSLGVVSIIVPYNWPLAIASTSLGYALVAGNVVVVKPPPTAPLAIVLTLQQMARHLPPGVLTVLTGDDHVIGRVVVNDPLVRKLVFTGSIPTGKLLIRAAADNLTRITLELGGNDAGIVLRDVEVDKATIERLVMGSLGITSGQVCMAIKQLYVHSSRYDEVVTGMSEFLAQARIGDGLDPDSTMGPLNNARQRDYVAGLLDDARAGGTEVRQLGELMEEDSAGHFLRPALVLSPDPSARIVVEEQFGPALPILPFDDEDAIVDKVNSEWAGLCSSVWSADLDHAGEVARRLRTGTVWVNTHNAASLDDRAPFGGFRQSGIGREMGPDGVLGYTETRSLTYGT
jgi:acyl-CoA reductase-like NAD-dependent aldehyde dehydrogenase